MWSALKSTQTFPMNVDLKVKKDTASSLELIQSKLLKPNELATYAQKYGLSILNQKYIVGLWRLGILHADIICSKHAL